MQPLLGQIPGDQRVVNTVQIEDIVHPIEVDQIRRRSFGLDTTIGH